MQAMLVNQNQKDNPILKYVRHIKYDTLPNTPADYICGVSHAIGVLYLSVQYHLIRSHYIEGRIGEMGDAYKVRVLLCLVDVEGCEETIQTLNKLCFNRNFTLLLAWSKEELARYLECLHIYEGRSSASIQEKVENKFMPYMVKALTCIKPINRTDVSTLLSTFGSLSGVCAATEEQLGSCPGLGDRKVRKLIDVLHVSFK